MNIQEHVSKVQAQLDAAAALGDERTREIATALGTAAASSVRLAIIDALASAATEANAALFAAAGGQPAPAIAFTVTGDAVQASVSSPPAADEDPTARPDDGDTSARISLRLSEALKADIETAAAAADLSVNSWLVRVAAAAARQEGPGGSWLGGGGWGGWKGWASGNTGWPHSQGGNRMTGWVTG